MPASSSAGDQPPRGERGALARVAENSAWLIGDKTLRLLIGVLVGTAVARYLGPSAFGELAYVLAFIALFQALASLGLDGIIVRDIARGSSQASVVLGTAFGLRLLIGSASWLVAVCLMALLNGPGDRSVLLASLAGAGLVFQAADTVDLWFQSQSQSRLTVGARLAALLLSSGVRILLILAGAPLAAFAATFTLEALLAALGLMLQYRRHPCPHRWQLARNMAIGLLSEGWPFMLSAVSIMIYMRVDQVFIRAILGERELGIYAAVIPFATVWQFVPMALSASLAPYVAQQKLAGEDGYWTALERIFAAFALLGWLVCLPTVALAGVVIPLLLGPEFREGSTVLAIYVFTNLFINMGVAQGLWLLNERLPMVSLWKSMIGAAVCVLGNLILLPLMGLNGAAVVGVVAQMSSAVLSNVLFSQRILMLQIKSLLLLSVRWRYDR